ncbi:heparan-alpha-glucosaminide N-acetyltransferase domain-containing protein, partial [Janthinobacterium sp. UMAB-56]|uniref:heparan-alpha-glucosaminide N-acetyltransferase domain-containing protein n=1 Tax=Janthinobacterium sp. UMAB-56 TaxID=1365361 RepID=UPI00214C5FEE
LYAHPAAGPRSAAGFLFKRGLLLLVLELVFVNFAWSGAFPPAILYLQVIWVIGLAMMALAVLHKLPLKVLLLLGVAIIAGQHLITGLRAQEGSLGHYLLTVLLQRGYLVADGAMKIKVSYPLLPWIGVIVLGYAAGPLYARSRSPQERRRWLLALGGGSLLLLAVLRGFNLYGETLPWVAGESAVRTAMSVLNFTKYPPSLDFLLFTLGLGLLGLAWLESLDNWFTRACATFGGAPMFYYLLHLYLLLAIGLTLTAVLGANHGARYGVEHIWQVWLLALLLMPVLYFPCRAFANYKRTSKQAWVRYF